MSNPLILVNELLVLVHLTGMAILVGSFILNMRKKQDFPFKLMAWAAGIQLFTGTLLVGLAYAVGDDLPDNTKIPIKALLATGALIASIIGAKRQSKKVAKLQPFFHTAGGFAVINLVIAVLWSAEIWS